MKHEVSDEFLTAVLRLVAYLEDAGEMEHYEWTLAAGADASDHIYIQMRAAREALSALGFKDLPDCPEWGIMPMSGDKVPLN